MANRYQIQLNKDISEAKEISLSECSKGGEHQWGTDDQHSNEYCKKCFVKHSGVERTP